MKIFRHLLGASLAVRVRSFRCCCCCCCFLRTTGVFGITMAPGNFDKVIHLQRKWFSIYKANWWHSLLFNSPTCFLQRKQGGFLQCKSAEPACRQRQTCYFTEGSEFPEETCVANGTGKKRNTDRNNQERIPTQECSLG